METTIAKLKGVYLQLKEKKAFGKVGLGLLVASIFIPVPMIRTVTAIALILWASCYVAYLLPENFSITLNKTPQKEADKTAPVSAEKDYRAGFVTVMQTYVTELLKSEVEDAEWKWGIEFSSLEYCNFLDSGHEVRVFLTNDEFDAADIQIFPTVSVKLINFVCVWFEETARDQISELVFEANSQGQKKLLLNSEVIPEFPEESRWDEVLDLLLDEGYKGEVEQDGVSITWPKKKVTKISMLHAALPESEVA